MRRVASVLLTTAVLTACADDIASPPLEMSRAATVANTVGGPTLQGAVAGEPLAGQGWFSGATCPAGLFKLFAIEGTDLYTGTIINPGPTSVWNADLWNIALANGTKTMTILGTPGGPGGRTAFPARLDVYIDGASHAPMTVWTSDGAASAVAMATAKQLRVTGFSWANPSPAVNRVGPCAANQSLGGNDIAGNFSVEVADAITDDFSGASLDATKWQVVTSGIPQGSASFTQSGGVIDLRNRAHLNSVTRFDPTATGGLRVAGEWTVAGAGDDFIQILTRSNGTPGGGFGETQTGIVFLAFTSHVGEAPNLMTIGGAGVGSVASTGSLVISPNVTYLFDVVDNGTSLRFTLTRKDDPSKSRTVSAPVTSYVGDGRVVFHNRELCCGGHHVARLDNVSIAGTAINHAPTAVITGPASLEEGQSGTYSAASSTDIDGDVLTFSWDADDDGVFEHSGGSLVASFPDDGTYEIALRATDPAGASHTTTLSVTVANANPAIAALTAVSMTPGVAGAVYSASGAFTDVAADTHTGTVDYGDGTGVQSLTLGAGNTFSLSHVYSVPAGARTVTVRITDDDGGVGERSFAANVPNMAPVANAGGPYGPVIVGESITLNGSGSDRNGDAITFSWDLNGDGTADATGATPSVSFATAGSHTITLTASDGGGMTGTATATVTVQTAAQAAEELTNTIDALVAGGQLSNGDATALNASLDAAAQSLANGNTTAADNQLNAFINKVNAQRGKKLTSAQADQLIAAANRIRAHAGG